MMRKTGGTWGRVEMQRLREHNINGTLKEREGEVELRAGYTFWKGQVAYDNMKGM